MKVERDLKSSTFLSGKNVKVLNYNTLYFVVPVEQMSNSFLEDLKLLAQLAA